MDEQRDLSGIKAAVRAGRSGGRGKGKSADGVEWELDLEGDGTMKMEGRERLPVLVTLNLVCIRPIALTVAIANSADTRNFFDVLGCRATRGDCLSR